MAIRHQQASADERAGGLPANRSAITAMRGLVALLGLAAGCTGDNQISLIVDTSTRSVVIGARTDDEVLVFADDVVDGRAAIRSLGAVESADLVALSYPVPLVQLGLASGPVPASVDPFARTLPVANSVRQARIDGGQPTEDWIEGQLPDWLARFRFLSLDPRLCAETGGCLTSTDLTASCNVPCADTTTPTPPVAPDLPSPPAAPQLTPCPIGWTEMSVDGLDGCAPWPNEAPDECDSPDTHFVGTPACAPLGAPCPIDEWPSAPDGAVFVQPGAVGGNGTRTAPFGSLTEALAAAPAHVVLAAGAYPESGRLSEPVEIIGACASATRVTGDWSIDGTNIALRDITFSQASITVSPGASLRLDAMAFIDSPGPAISVAAGANLDAERLRIEGASGTGVQVLGGEALLRSVDIERTVEFGIRIDETGRLTLEDASIRATRLTNGDAGLGVFVDDGSVASLFRVHFLSNHAVQVLARGDNTQLTLTDAVMLDALPIANGSFGRGIEVSNNASASLRRVRIDRAADRGIYAIASAQILGEDVLVARTDDTGIDIDAGSQVTVARASLEDTNEGIEMTGAGSTLDAHDLHVRRSRSFGVLTGQGTELTLNRAHVAQGRGFGIAVTGSGASASLIDTTVTRMASTELPPDGIVFIDAATSTVQRALISDVGGEGLVVLNTESSVEDITLQAIGAAPNPLQLTGAIVVTDAAAFRVERASVDNVRGVGVRLLRSRAVLRDIDVAQVRSSTLCAAPGYGVYATGGDVDAERVRIVSADTVGLAALGSADIETSNLLIEDTRLGSCSTGGIIGMLAAAGSRVRAQRLAIRNNVRTGVAVQDSALISIMNGVIEGHRGGLAIAGPTARPTDVLVNVVYRDNETAIIAGPEAENSSSPDVDSSSPDVDSSSLGIGRRWRLFRCL